jgi:hypothetical protein
MKTPGVLDWVKPLCRSTTQATSDIVDYGEHKEAEPGLESGIAGTNLGACRQ